jgi:hypothetical protein
VSEPRDPAFERALTQACDEHGLQVEYRDCVRPILRAPEEQWPQCCGGNCEPCNALLVRVARRVIAIRNGG